ncbi:hypothetical protein ABK040_016449 [Willaertia magna]
MQNNKFLLFSFFLLFFFFLLSNEIHAFPIRIGLDNNNNIINNNNNKRIIINNHNNNNNPYIQPGINNYNKLLSLLSGETIGLLTNPSGITFNGESTIHYLINLSQQNNNNNNSFTLNALFAPEHGIYGDKPPGQKFRDYIDPITKLPVYSLYFSDNNNDNKPLPYMLNNLTMLIMDIQDVGIRPFTFISSMVNCMLGVKSYNENYNKKIKFIVLDRINPLDGNVVQGMTLDLQYKSFIGIWKIPLVHGMTMGELALLFDDQMGINLRKDNLLNIIEVKDDLKNNYSQLRPSLREINNFLNEPLMGRYVPPSPNLPSLEAIELYSGFVLFESLYNVSVGRGTTSPFVMIGAPYINSIQWINLLNTKYKKELQKYFKYITMTYPTFFTPITDIYTNVQCEGIRFIVNPPLESENLKEYFENFVPMSFTLMKSLIDLFDPIQQLGWRSSFAKILFGNDLTINQLLDKSISVEDMVNSWKNDLDNFRKLRESYLLYKRV